MQRKKPYKNKGGENERVDKRVRNQQRMRKKEERNG